MTENFVAYEWDDTIENDGDQRVVLPAGDYDFKIVGFTRGRFEGSAKMGSCNMATVEVEVSGTECTAAIKHNLFLNSKCEWALCNFFLGIGDRKHGEPLKPNWSATHLIGKTGRLKLGVNTWKNSKTGEDSQGNEIKTFYEHLEAQSKAKYVPGVF